MTAMSQSVADVHVAISGASGYLGRALIDDCLLSGRRFGALSHSGRMRQDVGGGGACFVGDLLQPDTMTGWLQPGQTVVHLAYMWSAGEAANLQATENLLAACRASGVRRLVHVSTAAVVGRADTAWVDETTPCRPATDYGRTKLRIEEAVRRFSTAADVDTVILRPTSVFGPAGAPLEKLCRDLRELGWFRNYMRTCLFGRRAMNLVSIENVVAAIRFAIDYPDHFGGETLIVSDDEDPKNNFADVESILRNVMGLGDYPIPPVPLPRIVLEMMLRSMRRNIVDTRCRFRSARLRALGFVPPLAFENALVGYARWSRQMDDARRSSHATGEDGRR